MRLGTPWLAIVGPTASGKTAYALSLAKKQKSEIISVDSRQVYRRLRVGTAKPTGKWTTISRSPRQAVSRGPSSGMIDPPSATEASADVRQRCSGWPPATLPAGRQARGIDEKSVYLVEGIPYHLVDILEPDQTFSAADFVRLAREKAAEITSRGNTPIFVGGTGLYFKALTEGLADLPPADDRVRDRLKKEAEEKGRIHLLKRLQTIDPIAAGRIPANNIQRLVRALEIYELTGLPISHWHKAHKKQGLAITFHGIDLPREELHRRIEARCRRMMEEGIIEETRSLLDQGFPESCPALSGLGYPRVISFLKGEISKDECLRLLAQDTRQYAKRQMTYFRHQLSVTWNRP